MGKTVANIIVDTLEAAGVRNCYGIVGDTLNHIAGCLSKSSIDWVHVRHEEAGAFAAQTEALLMDRLTAMAGSCGPGSLHFINGIYEAQRNRAPVILLATQVTREELGFRYIQEVDFKTLYRDCTVFCDMIYEPEQALRKTVLACQTAIAMRGPAVLIIPVDVATAQAHDTTPFTVQITHPVLTPSEDELDRIAASLNQGGDIVIYGGAGCDGARDEVLALAEKLKAPIAHTSRGKDFLEFGNAHSIGMTGMLGNEAAYNAVLHCDTLIQLGADFAWRQFYPKNATIIQIDSEPTHLGQRFPVSISATGHIKPTIKAILPKINPRASSTFYNKTLDHHGRVMAHLDAKAAEPGPRGKIPGKYVGTLLDQLANEDAIFCSDDGTPTVWMVRHIKATARRRTFASLLHGTMASGMPSALGAQKAQMDRQVIALCGDGGLTMLFGDILTTLQENLPVKMIVVDNGKLGFVEIEQKTEGMLNTYTDLKNPNFGDVAQAMGLWGQTVDEAECLEDAMKDWLVQPGPALLHVIVEPMELVMPPFVALQPAIGMALYGAKAVLHGHGDDVIGMMDQNR